MDIKVIFYGVFWMILIVVIVVVMFFFFVCGGFGFIS